MSTDKNDVGTKKKTSTQRKKDSTLPPSDDKENPTAPTPTDDKENPTEPTPTDDKENPTEPTPTDDQEKPTEPTPTDDQEKRKTEINKLLFNREKGKITLFVALSENDTEEASSELDEDVVDVDRLEGVIKQAVDSINKNAHNADIKKEMSLLMKSISKDVTNGEFSKKQVSDAEIEKTLEYLRDAIQKAEEFGLVYTEKGEQITGAIAGEKGIVLVSE
ncbi:hypothetical protein GTG28_20570 [Vibrio sp. OCN044]|uniref:Uncharacterized protein n=1 Tax=Vibrio tetraodonis subsp. pristinus TaxID=2695891 RepID=A0A6L8LZR3_9VIBR|nr:hypothetical protein [Vibrio tetraodonis]MYM61598.1 hypothetical protein [Vibrio tetraodonis subsp. pristinus]